MNEKIFVSIASYKDSDLINTINDLYYKAKNPKRVFVGLFIQDAFDQINKINILLHPNNHPYSKNIKIKTISFEQAKGCGWARNIILKELYNNEKYFMCVDSHSRFLKDWDEVYIHKYKNAPENAVISAFPQSFEFGQSYEEYTKKNIGTIYTPNGLPWTNEFKHPHCQRHPKVSYEKVMSVSGGNLFGDYRLPKAITLDNYTYKHNQEQEIYSLLIFLYGLDIYAIPKNIVWHKYISVDSYRDIFVPNKIEYVLDFLTSLKYKEGARTIDEWIALIKEDCEACKKTKQFNS